MILVPVASMGDIAFLLIIFFMVCSRFAKDPGVTIDLPTTNDVTKLDDYPMVVIIDKKGKIYFQGGEISGPEQLENEIQRLVEGKTTEKARTVLVRCDQKVRGRYLPVFQAIAKGGGKPALVGHKSKPE